MYLYFDKAGNLKEIINDEALRQGNYGVNKLYIYIADRSDVNSITARYLLPSKLIIGPLGPFSTKSGEMYIPYDPKRDLLFFKYTEKYNFFVIDLSEGDSQDPQVIGNTPLDEAGVVHCNLTMNLTGGNSYALGDVNFCVEENQSLNQHYVASQEYMSLADYLYLFTLINDFIPYTGATQDVNLGEFKLFTSWLAFSTESAGSLQGIKFTEATSESPSEIEIFNGDGLAWFNVDYGLYYGGTSADNEVANHKWVSDAIKDLKDDIEDGTVIAHDATNTNFTNGLYAFHLVESDGSVSLSSGTATYHMYWTSSLIALEAESVNFGIVYVGTGIMNVFGKDVSGNEYILYLIGNSGTLYKKATNEDEFSEFGSGFILAKQIK